MIGTRKVSSILMGFAFLLQTSLRPLVSSTQSFAAEKGSARYSPNEMTPSRGNAIYLPSRNSIPKESEIM